MPPARVPDEVTYGLRRIGADLAAWRRRRQLTVAQVAGRARVSKHTVLRIEAGDGASLQNVLRVAAALDVLDLLATAVDTRATGLGRVRPDEALQLRVRPPRAEAPRETPREK